MLGQGRSTTLFSAATMTPVNGNVVGVKGYCEDADEALDVERLGGSDGSAAGSNVAKGSPWSLFGGSLLLRVGRQRCSLRSLCGEISTTKGWEAIMRVRR